VRTSPRESASLARYVARVERASGRERRGPIDPDELLIHAHRDHHLVEVAVHYLASRLVDLTGSEWLVARGVREVHRLAERLAGAVGAAAGSPGLEAAVRGLLGVAGWEQRFRFRQSGRTAEGEPDPVIERLRRDAQAALSARGENPRLRFLLTGATGFLGKEILVQAASDPRIEEVVCLVRPEVVRHRRKGRVLRVLGAPERGRRLLRRLGIRRGDARKFRFVQGDVEKPRLGLGAKEVRRLERSLTHLVHCAASVSFDESYESSFRANVLGSRRALDLSLRLQRAPASPFVAHVAIETSYIHGRARPGGASEERLEFPLHYYNNHYELTKALATLETDRAMRRRGLRVAQILPSIVIGNSRSGSNRGDTKVVNAPINVFGRIKEAVEAGPPGWRSRLRALVIGRMATAFPADRTAELNLVPVDRVAAGVIAALTAPAAIGARIHLAADHRVRSAEMARVIRQEVGIGVHTADPTLSRNLVVPLRTALLTVLGEGRLAQALERLGTIFGVYSEWGQPVHGVGNDVGILGLPRRRPDSLQVFRMICRYNRYVLRFGRIKDDGEIARRERLWEEAVGGLEFELGRPPAALGPEEFARALEARLDLVRFRPQPAAEA
jgi:nucleoside-diphosphate-sugar epimerase